MTAIARDLPLPMRVTTWIQKGLGEPTQRFDPVQRSGYVDFTLDSWDAMPRRGEAITVSFSPGQTLSMRVKYRRRYPDREIARMWFVSDE